jgi:hypothetical protein
MFVFFKTSAGSCNRTLYASAGGYVYNPVTPGLATLACFGVISTMIANKHIVATRPGVDGIELQLLASAGVGPSSPHHTLAHTNSASCIGFKPIQVGSPLLDMLLLLNAAVSDATVVAVSCLLLCVFRCGCP